MALNEKDAEFWDDRLFDQAVATAKRRMLIESMGHPPLRISRGTGGDEGDADPKVGETDWEPVVVGELPRAARSFAKKLMIGGYGVNAYIRTGERRGAHGRLLDPPSGRFALIAAQRGREAFTAMWGEVKGKWEAASMLDYTDEGGITPTAKTITQLKKDRT